MISYYDFKRIQNAIVLAIVGILIVYYVFNFKLYTPFGFGVFILVMSIIYFLVTFFYNPLLPPSRYE